MFIIYVSSKELKVEIMKWLNKMENGAEGFKKRVVSGMSVCYDPDRERNAVTPKYVEATVRNKEEFERFKKTLKNGFRLGVH